MVELRVDVLVVGGGLGGVSAALAAARLGRRVLLAEPTDWLGGQLTSQAVPPDEHQWMEMFGGSRSYRMLRSGIRRYYRRHYPLTASARADPFFNPGASLVSRVGGEPRVGVAVIDEMLATERAAGRLETLPRHVPVSVERDGDLVTAVVLRAADTGDLITVVARYVLDATETGDLLPLAGAEYVTGRESRDETGEPHGVPGPPDPYDQQSITYVAALEYFPGEQHVIDRPDSYAFWRGYRAPFEDHPHLSWTPKKSDRFQLFPDSAGEHFSIWQYRRVRYAPHFSASISSEATLLNCPQNDYWLAPIVDVPADAVGRALAEARGLTRSVVYWLQTEAPRPDGGQGWPGLRLAPEVVGTVDGLAMHPYVRESRRIRAEMTILEQHVGVDARPGREGAEEFADSVGIGAYRLDLHSTTGGQPGINLPAWPFQIPLGALIPVRLENLLPAAKNIGTTQITNGCYRLHPVEWSIGEAAGALAAFCLQRGAVPRQVRHDKVLLGEFQALLTRQGVELAWLPGIGPAGSYYKWAVGQPGWEWGRSASETVA